MKIGFVIYNGMTSLDFVGVSEGVTRLKTMGFIPDLEWEICARTPQVSDGSGLLFTPTRVSEPLDDLDVLIVPGGPGSQALLEDADFIQWLKTAMACQYKVSVGSGAVLLGAAGFLEGWRATTHSTATHELRRFAAAVIDQRIVEDGGVITAGGVTASIELGLYLCEKLAGRPAAEAIRRQMDYQSGVLAAMYPGDAAYSRRHATVLRETRETHIELTLHLDGSGQAEISTGLGFFDHMLTQIAVHGLFDIQLKASGDLNIDAHHIVEDVALALGKAFDQALGDRVGIVRMASASVPMDEALAFVAVDLSGRPYAVLDTGWKTPAIGPIPTSLLDHFYESFATAARCSLHARLLCGRDDHHQAEALFKAFARALDAATQIDPRRAGSVPSSKGTI